MGPLGTDRFGRRVDYLRISVTDRCNMRCGYCMPADGIPLLPREEILSYDEIERVARVAHSEGISRIRVTGGEPLVRKDLTYLLGRLVNLLGPDSVALTTNGTLLADHAEELRRAGLARINLSLDSLDVERYHRITRGGELSSALDGLRAAQEAGFEPIKVNAVATEGLRREVDAFLDLVVHAGLHVRFIERMHVGDERTPPTEEPLTADDVLALVVERAHARGLGEPVALARADGPYGWGPARYYRLGSATGTIGIIAPVSRHFCAECSRLRLTADGHLRPCLFSDEEIDVASITQDESALRRAIRDAIDRRPPGHGVPQHASRTMSQIGG